MGQIRKTVSEFIEDTPLSAVGPEDSIAAAIEVMKRDQSDCVVVLDAGMIVGIFTERDFLNRVTAARRDPAETKMKSAMTPNPEVLRTYDCISYAINRMAVGGFRNVPIIGEQGKPIAVLSVRDVVSHLSELFDEVSPVREPSRSAWVDIGGG